jgi:hypothetical protein
MKNSRLNSKLKIDQTKGIALLFWLLVFSGGLGIKVKAQGFYNAEVDRTSYEASLDKNWKKVIEIGEGAQAKGIDFYYLRLRKGIAYDNLGKYNRSDLEYRKANAFFPVDTLTYWYRYVALINSGRESEARVLSSKMTSWQRGYSGYKQTRLNLVSLEGGGLIGDAPESTLENQGQVYLKQKQQGNLVFVSGLVNAWLGNRINLTFGYLYMNVGNTNYFTHRLGSPNPGNNKIQYDLWKLRTNQNGIYAGLNYQFSKGWSLFASANFLFYSGNSIQIDKILGETLAFSIYEYNFNGLDYTCLGMIKKRWSRVALEGSYSFNRVSEVSLHQSNLALTYFPIGNNKVYLTGQLSTISQSSTNLIGGIKVGGRMAKWIWVEGNFMAGRMYGTSDAAGWILNNNPDQINWKAGLNFSLIIKNRVEIPIRFGLLGREGVSYKEIMNSKNDIPVEQAFPYTYMHFLINTGIKIYF